MAFWAFLGDFVAGMSFGSIWVVIYLGGDVIGSYNFFFLFYRGVLVVWIFLNFDFCFLLIVF